MVGDELELGRPVLGEEMRSALGTALRALLWASEELELDAGLRAEWRAGLQWLGGETSPYKFECTLPLGELCSEEAVTKLRAWIQELPQREQGWFAPKPHTPYLHLSGQVGAAISALLLREEPANGHSVISIGVPERAEGFGGMPSGVLQIFASLPPMWNAAFNLAAPGGFRICAEAIDGKARYVAVRSLLGGVCRIANPWGAGIWSRVVDGRQVVFESDAAVLDLETRRGGIYLIERADSPLGRVLRIRLRGRRNELPKILGSRMLGLNSVVSGQ